MCPYRRCNCDQQRVPRRRARVGGLCVFRSPAERVPTESRKIGRCATVRQKNSTEAQRSGFGRKRRCSGMDENCRLRRGEGYGACIDEAARQPAMDLSRDKNAEEMKWSPLEMGAAKQAHGA